MHTRIAIVIPSGPGEKHVPGATEWVLLAADAPAARILKVSALREAVHRARTHEASHLAVVQGRLLAEGSDLQRLAEACRSRPEAVIIGRRQVPTETGWSSGWSERMLPRFWLKIQTGRHLEDPASPMRIYPLAALDHLRLYQGGRALDTEILVKSAWADIPFQEVAVDTDMSATGMEREPLWRNVWRFLLNIHYTLRSVLPVPHRKLVARDDKPGEAVSVWRPMRSLRTLLRENTSPTQLALAAAMGVFLGTLPLIALHTLVIILAATYFRLNKVAALSASQLCMPPVVPALCIEIGYLLRHGHFLTEISLETIGYQALERLYEWLLGSLLLAPLLACLMGGMTFILARAAARSMAGVRNVNSTPGNDAGH
jgi:uncharacterized protein (DUF2062 family)